MFVLGHAYVNGSLTDQELGQCMKHLQGARAHSTFAELGQYIDRFTLPKSSPSVTRLFTASANKNNLRKGGFTCSAGEFLTLAPIALRYFERVAMHMGRVLASSGIDGCCLEGRSVARQVQHMYCAG